ncbi:MAG: DUF2946 family protein [Betaproteobacteria bacterium]
MILQRSLRKGAAIAAMLALVLQALWPLVSQAASRERTELVPLCTVDGITHFLELKLGKTPLEKRTALHGEHCKLCVFGADRLAVLPPPVAVALLVDLPAAMPSVASATLLPDSFSHPPAQPRAPPAGL